MLIPASFKASYEAELAVVESIENIAGARLRQLCNQNHWLFDQRMKDAESVLAKLQLGRISSIRLVADFYAAVVVVPTRLQLEEAVDTVSALFARADVRRERNVDPLSFPYDDVHLIAQMGAGPVVPHSSGDTTL